MGIFDFFKKKKDEENQVNSSGKQSHGRKADPSVYPGLRRMAFGITPEQLGLSLPHEQHIVYGVIMDWHIGSGIVTLVCFKSGDASMYLSSGGGTIGGGQHENVSRDARLFVEQAQAYLIQTTLTESTPLPGNGEVFFYLLTNKGVFTTTENMQNIENQSSVWLPFFDQANKVIYEIRMVTPS